MTDTPASERPPIAAAVIVQDGKVLLVQRRVKEGSLSWQFPAGEVETGETGEQTAVCETQEETGVTVSATKTLGERIHPNTGRTMIYVARKVESGTARVVDTDELVNFAWPAKNDLATYVPYPFYSPVQEYLDASLVVIN